MKSICLALKGKNGYINIEFHKQPLSKAHLDRDFEYVVGCYFHYGETMDQRIVILDDSRKSVEKLQILSNLVYEAPCYYASHIDGATVLNIIKNKTEHNEKLTDYEQYVFSILPLTDHGHDNVEKLIEELCKLTKKLNISEKNKEAIALCQMILVDIFVNDDALKEELIGVITMTSSYIEERENKLKRLVEQEAKKAEQEAKKAELEAKKAEQEAKKAELEAKKAEQEAKKAQYEREKRLKAEQEFEMVRKQEMQKRITAEEKLKKIDRIIKGDTNGLKNNKIDQKTIQKILAITSKI